MNLDVVELIEGMDFKDTELQLGLQCAPVIAGLKAANLYTIQTARISELREALSKAPLQSALLYEGRGRSVFLIYEIDSLQAYLNSEPVANCLRKFGYSSSTLSKILPEFSCRYRAFMRGEGTFPHELGFLLAYPIEDVLGFIEHKGKNFLLNGYWKVYQKKDEKALLFRNFEEIQMEIVYFLRENRRLTEIIAFYRALKKQEIGLTRVEVA